MTMKIKITKSKEINLDQVSGFIHQRTFSQILLKTTLMIQYLDLSRILPSVSEISKTNTKQRTNFLIREN